MTQDAPEILYARQPIYEHALAIAGFGLLFRNGYALNTAPARFDGNVATSRVLMNAFSESNIDEVYSNMPAFINFTAERLAGAIPFSWLSKCWSLLRRRRRLSRR